jgi:hypothetical protein
MKTKALLAAVIFVSYPLLAGCATVRHETQLLRVEPTPVVKSPASPKESVEYKIGRRRFLERPQMLHLQISIAPALFVREKMDALAQKLNSDFSNERKVGATILDDEQIAQNPPPVGAAYPFFEKVNRGQYYLDRAKGYEYIAFSTERGRPANEVVINLGPNRPKWLRAATHSKSRQKRK